MSSKLLDFSDVREKRDTSVNVRIRASVVMKLKKITDRYGVSQADVMERLIEQGFEEMKELGVRNRKK